MRIAIKQELTNTFKNYRWLLHLLFWLLFTGFIAYSFKVWGIYKEPAFPAPFPLLSVIANVGIIFLQSYIFLLLVVPLNSGTKRYKFWFAFFALLACCYLLEVCLIRLIVLQIPSFNAKPEFQLMALLSRNTMNYVFLSAIFIAFYYFIDIYDRQQELRRLEAFKTQKIALESSFLKSQINPHFLFNTLNNIYALSLKQSEQTPVIIERLESLLHYMLYECKADLVPLENEFKFTNSYIDLEKLRHHEDQCKVTVSIKGEPDHHKIAPLLLINFLENAFKHGTKTSFGKSWINMEIVISVKRLHFKLLNSKPTKPVNTVKSEYTGGIGLKNVKRRLEILYPGKHKLMINDAADHFEIDLTINF